MHFGNHVIRYEVFGISMIGNIATGYTIGLTDSGAAICERMFEGDVPASEVESTDQNLAFHLEKGGFCDDFPILPSVESAYLHVTTRCNLKCVGCYAEGDKDHLPFMEKSFDEVISYVDYLFGKGVGRLVISGGEPFLRDDLLDIVKYAKTKNPLCDISILTNGTVLRRVKLELFSPYVNCIAISFDGHSEESVAYVRGEQRFSLLVGAVERVKRAGIGVRMIPTLHSKNVDDFDCYVELAERLGAALNFSLLSRPSRGCNESPLFFDDVALRKLARKVYLSCERGRGLGAVGEFGLYRPISSRVSCGAGCATLSVSSQGKVYPCHMMHCEELAIGGVERFNGFKRNDSSLFMPVTVDEIDGCRDCVFRYQCGGGCRARAYSLTGDIKARDPYCAFMEEYYRLLFGKLIKAEA